MLVLDGLRLAHDDVFVFQRERHLVNHAVRPHDDGRERAILLVDVVDVEIGIDVAVRRFGFERLVVVRRLRDFFNQFPVRKIHSRSIGFFGGESFRFVRFRQGFIRRAFEFFHRRRTVVLAAAFVIVVQQVAVEQIAARQARPFAIRRTEHPRAAHACLFLVRRFARDGDFVRTPGDFLDGIAVFFAVIRHQSRVPVAGGNARDRAAFRALISSAGNLRQSVKFQHGAANFVLGNFRALDNAQRQFVLVFQKHRALAAVQSGKVRVLLAMA